MESKRQQKVGKLIQKDVSEIFQKEASHLLSGTFATVSIVKVTPDFGLAKIYLSFLNDQNKEIYLERIRESSGLIRSVLGQKVRHQLRNVPQLQFYIDDTAEYVANIERLFAGIVIPPLVNE